jgi:NitT/TauT family transport system permease protein
MAQESLHADLMFALLIWIGLVGWLLNRSLLALQPRLFRAQDQPTTDRKATR